MTVGTYTQAAAELAGIAAENAMRYYRTAIDAETKSDGSPVTAADKSSERLVREWIELRFPSDGILGEEFGAHNVNARRRWIVDPIDGTKAFIRGVPFWGSLVAVVEGETVIAGAASFPALGETLIAGRGEGCWWNDAKCSVSTVDRMSNATVLTTDLAFRNDGAKQKGWLALAERAANSRTWGDCVGYLLVATGRAEVMTDPIVSEWDVAALMPAIVEAGGVFTDWDGNTTAFGKSAVATNTELATEARSILSQFARKETQ
jgi:histidinol phosphatase-like enzyme (inositol monophosphatase family)